MSLIKKFLEMVSDDSKDVNVNPLLESDRDKAVFEKWVAIFNELEPIAIVPTLERISRTYKMAKRDEIILLSYVKFFEQNILKMNKFMEEGLEGLHDTKKEKKKKYDGAMFG